MAVTRMTILDHVEEAFGRGPMTTEQMREVAAGKGAEPDALVVLGELPSRTFAGPRDIWPYLPDLPVGV